VLRKWRDEGRIAAALVQPGCDVFVTRLTRLDESAHTGPEFSDLSRGSDDLDRIDLRGSDLALIDWQPPVLKEFTLADHAALLVEAAASADLDRGRS